ncbi:carbohydrate ABC transporter ATP-binding protein, CUT1 family [Thermaerobacter marianensis DSM 12885]|uniref:Carbohydrate ABC transporter ATP-binding protein, CUT1 family n=1 Tax=Thermaerobacter marianensis (strain ATCC 700841 / DSM 12885 / JCM 10246 / 7p75a) TaxID=644966 RepID=E6SIN8_THEM7|nr:ABC transporter ATP-binding protein [Thermaerobacter marianensis]ADU51982.1 carbohydrate ABC transporter ATP-binding protein, CUT1 family [Thermaerobacter marianensis DSM 12885]
MQDRGAIRFEGATKRFDGVTALDRLDLTVEPGERLVLLGPSGCGKSTALRLVAGLEELTDGELYIDGRPASRWAPGERDVAMVFQNYAIYPHLDVFENIAFGLRLRRVPEAEIRQRVGRVTELLGLDKLLRRKPRELSGGQRQRVALGRALVRDARILLMDEPLSNLDAQLRVRFRTELIELHRRWGATMLYVTHDQVEALTLGDRVAVLREGRLQQVDTPERIYWRPVNTFVATFVGTPPMNLVPVRIRGTHVQLGDHSLRLPERRAAFLARYRREEWLLGVRPESVFVERANEPRPGAGERAALRVPGRVHLCEFLGGQVVVHVEVGTNLRLQALVPSDRRVAEGEAVSVLVPEEQLYFFVPETGTAVYPDEGGTAHREAALALGAGAAEGRG